MTSDAARWGPDSPTPAQLKEFFAQVEAGRITRVSLQEFLRHGAGAAVPADNEWFVLEVDDDPTEGFYSVRSNHEGWTYLGPKPVGTKAYCVKLVWLGLCQNLADAKERVDKFGLRLLEGQACWSFKTKYVVPGDKNIIVFGGSEWRDPDGSERVAHLCGQGDVWDSDFSHSGGVFDDSYRWAVVGK